MRNYFEFFSLSKKEKILFFQAFYYLILFRIILVQKPPKDLFRDAARVVNCHLETQSLDHKLPTTIARIVNQVSRYIPLTTCLSKAYTCMWLFAKNKYKSELHFGIYFNDQRELKAHAWLTFKGKIVIGDLPDLSKYQEIPLRYQERKG